MEMTLAPERIFLLQPQLPFAEAQRRVEERKVNLLAGTFGSLFTRPNPAEIAVTYGEYRIEPFWYISLRTRTVYDRPRTYTVTTGGPEVRHVSLLGQTLPADPQAKGGSALTLTVTEHCQEEHQFIRCFAADGSPFQDGPRLAGAPRHEISDLGLLQADGIIVVTPEAGATAVTRQVMSEAVQPVKAQVIHEERVAVEALDLCFRPVYAFELSWAAKGKRAVAEVDGLSGEVRSGGKTIKEHLRKMLSRDLLFDLSADAIGTFVPGGSIAVKLAKAVVDMNRK